MPKQIPVALQTHLDQEATTLCTLTRVECKDGTVLGFADLDANVVYDDGDGSVTYYAENGGFSLARVTASADTSVDNSELQGWVSATGITEASIRAGLFDYARVRIYRVNYMDLTNGHEIVATGTAGETTYSENGWRTEFRAIKQQLKQTFSNLYSIACPVKFGSTKCGKAFTWASGTVSLVGLETDRVFEDSSRTEADAFYNLGVVEWLTGDNAGIEMEVDTFAADAFALSLPLPYPISIGDTYQVRKDCSKVWDDADNGCLFHWAAERADHFRGQPHIPIADAGAAMVPNPGRGVA